MKATKMSISAAPPLIRLLACSASAAVCAGAYIRQVKQSGQLGIVDKGLNDLQTQADRGSQRIITANLRAAFPGLTVIGEEKEDPSAAPLASDELVQPMSEVLTLCQRLPCGLAGARQEDLTVWVDPLDGTSDFAEHLLSSVTVLIGIALAGRAVAGLAYEPFGRGFLDDGGGGRLVWGLEGLGVFGLGEPPAPAPSGGSGGFVVTTTRSHWSRIVEAAVAACGPTEILRVGGCGHKALLLLERRAHAYVFASGGCHKWDTCAPEALLRAAGGRLTDMHGRQLSYRASAGRRNSQGVLAALRPEDHERCLRAAPADVLRELAATDSAGG